jgi:hypothetical protein
MLRETPTFDIDYRSPSDPSLRVLELAARYQCSAIHNARCLALANHLGYPFWTADERFYYAIRTDFPHIHWLAEHQWEQSV